jgi:hypothetical protein
MVDALCTGYRCGPFGRLKKGQVNGRVVLGLKEEKFAKVAIGRLAS